MEIGFPAVDRGTNAPNVFYDPKSSESALTHFSDGARNDVLQRRALEVSLSYWQAQSFVDAAFAWAWDARPWPDFPVRGDVWSDGPNWSLGHWLNGRAGLVPLSAVIEDLSALSGVEMEAGALDGLVEGFVVPAPSTLRSVLEPLQALHRFSCRESEAGLSLRPASRSALLNILADEIVGDGPSMTHVLLDNFRAISHSPISVPMTPMRQPLPMPAFRTATRATVSKPVCRSSCRRLKQPASQTTC